MPLAKSTTEGTPSPIASVASVRTCSIAVTISSTRPSALLVLVGRMYGSERAPSRSAATDTFVPPTSTPTVSVTALASYRQ